MRLELVTGDITEQRIDAIVNAADSGLLNGGGVHSAIHRRGGGQILIECQDLRRTTFPHGLAVADAVATGAGKLRSQIVIHAVGPAYDGSQACEDLLTRTYRRCLTIADQSLLGAVAFPLIGAGVSGWPTEAAARIAVNSVNRAATGVDLVRFVAFTDSSAEALAAALTE